MTAAETDIIYSSGNKKFRKILLIIAAVLAIITIILFIIPIGIPGPIFGFLILFICIDVFTLVWFTKKYYNWGLAFLFLIVAAIFFKNMRWPLTGILFATGFTGLSIVSLYYASKFLSNYKHIPFLRYIGFSSSIILSIVAIGLLWKNMHWPLAGMVLNTGLGLFIPFLFAFVFTLPGSNYINWNSTDRAVFFRAIIIPMAFVYTLCVLMFVLPELWTAITRKPMTPFYMWDFELLNKPGIL
jgi:hypothetical protein